MAVAANNSSAADYKHDLKNDDVKNEDGGVVLWSTLFLVEGMLVILLNFLTLLTFAVNAHLRKRSVYLPLSLSLADMFVGVSAVMYAGVMLETGRIYQYVSVDSVFVPAEIADIFFASLSLNYLVLISLERMYAAVAPFKHRSTSFRLYILAFALPWMMGVMSIGTFFIFARFYFFYASAVLTFLSLLLIGAFYVVIFVNVKLHHRQQQPAVQRHALITQRRERELAKTLFIVTVLSMLSWLPNGVFTAEHGSDSTLDKIAFSSRFMNSLINPVVYLYRLKDFRRAFWKLLSTCSSNKVLPGSSQMAASSSNNPTGGKQPSVSNTRRNLPSTEECVTQRGRPSRDEIPRAASKETYVNYSASGLREENGTHSCNNAGFDTDTGFTKNNETLKRADVIVETYDTVL